jgi:hypothetical protein
MFSQEMEQFDQVVAALEFALASVFASKGKMVQLPKAELDLLHSCEEIRNMLMDMLMKTSDDRSKLEEAFGGDCLRIVRVLACLEHAKRELSEHNAADQRVRHAKEECDVVVAVLNDMGHGSKIQAALQAQTGMILERATSTKKFAAEVEVLAAGAEDAEDSAQGTIARVDSAARMAADPHCGWLDRETSTRKFAAAAEAEVLAAGAEDAEGSAQRAMAMVDSAVHVAADQHRVLIERATSTTGLAEAEAEILAACAEGAEGSAHNPQRKYRPVVIWVPVVS